MERRETQVRQLCCGEADVVFQNPVGESKRMKRGFCVAYDMSKSSPTRSTEEKIFCKRLNGSGSDDV
jgi:hypothetical protein